MDPAEEPQLFALSALPDEATSSLITFRPQKAQQVPALDFELVNPSYTNHGKNDQGLTSTRQLFIDGDDALSRGVITPWLSGILVTLPLFLLMFLLRQQHHPSHATVRDEFQKVLRRLVLFHFSLYSMYALNALPNQDGLKVLSIYWKGEASSLWFLWSTSAAAMSFIINGLLLPALFVQDTPKEHAPRAPNRLKFMLSSFERGPLQVPLP